jgi:flagellar assembly protein FliH
MSSRARRVVQSLHVTPFAWGGSHQPATPSPSAPAPEPPPDLEQRQAQLAALERDAFAKGFAQGERAGLEAAGQRGEAMLRRLTETLEELTVVRDRMIHQTERQMVDLALAIARRIIDREVAIDRDLLIAMARVALDRLGETANITVRLNPDDFAVTGAAQAARLAGSNIEIVADARISRGGCRVDSDLGVLDAGIDAQLQEVARALLGEAEEVMVADAVRV